MDSPTPSWRERLPVHPAAELFPPMSDEELRDLGKDIKEKTGGKPAVPVTLIKAKDGQLSLLDSRNRLTAMELTGLPVLAQDDLPFPPYNIFEEGETADPFAFVASANLHRRHLTTEQKREIVRKLLEQRPNWSDRSIGKAAKVDHKTVGAARQANGENPHSPADRVEASGKKARGRKPNPQPKVRGRKPNPQPKAPNKTAAGDFMALPGIAKAISAFRQVRERYTTRVVHVGIARLALKALAVKPEELVSTGTGTGPAAAETPTPEQTVH